VFFAIKVSSHFDPIAAAWFMPQGRGHLTPADIGPTFFVTSVPSAEARKTRAFYHSTALVPKLSKAVIANRQRRVCSALQNRRLDTIHPVLAAEPLWVFRIEKPKILRMN
jgi:hypothetical protein